MKITSYSENPKYMNYTFKLYDYASIENLIFENIHINEVELVFKRYFPKSYKAYIYSWYKLSMVDIESNINNRHVADYYNGHPPTWEIVNNFTFKRDVFDRLHDVLEKENFCLLTGAGGEGKSTLLMQIGVFYYKKLGYDVYFNSEPDGSIDIIFKQIKKGKKILLIIDNASYFQQFEIFIQKAYFSSVKLILATRKNEWNAFLQNTKNSLLIKKYLSNSEIELGRLSNNELQNLEALLLKHDIIDRSMQTTQVDERSFLLATMIAYTQGKSLKMTLSDVVERISNFSNNGYSDKAIFALGSIVYMEQLPGINNQGLFCNRDLLFEILDVSRFEFNRIIDLIKGEAFIQSGKKHFITRNPIITELFYNILFVNDDKSYISEEDIVYAILRSCASSLTSFDKFILSYIPKYYLNKGQTEFSNEIYNYILSCGFFPESYNEILKNEIELISIDNEDSYVKFIDKMKELYYKDTSNYKLLLLWAKKQLELRHFGDYEVPFSSRWLLKQVYLLNPTFQELYHVWSNLEKECNNIGNKEEENSEIWVLKQGVIKSHDSALCLKWANIEIEKGNIGDIEKENSAIWILKQGIDKSNDAALYLVWANIEIEKGNVGDIGKENSAIWILKQGIDKSNDGALYLLWANIETEKGNIGDLEKENSAIWILKQGIDKTKNHHLYYLMAHLQFIKREFGKDVIEKYCVRWLYHRLATVYNRFHSYIYWAIVEFYLDSIGYNNLTFSANFLVTQAFDKSRFNYIIFKGKTFYSVGEFEEYMTSYLFDKKNISELLEKFEIDIELSTRKTNKG